MARKRFRAELEATTRGDAVCALPFDLEQAFGQAQAPVRVTVKGFTFSTTPFVLRGRQVIGISKANRAGAGVDIGDVVFVLIEPDVEPRTSTPPPDLAGAIEASSTRQAWDRLSHTQQREHVDAVEQAERHQIRARRIAQAIELLKVSAAQTDAGADPLAELLAGYPEPLGELVRGLRQLVLSAAPEAEERVQPGWRTIQFLPPGGSWSKKHGCAIVLRKNRVDLELPNGVSLQAPEGLLEGTGKAMRHVEVQSAADLSNPVLKSLVRQSMKLKS